MKGRGQKQSSELLFPASLTFALILCFSAVPSRRVHTGGRTVRVARLLRVEAVVPRSVALAAAGDGEVGGGVVHTDKSEISAIHLCS